MGFIFQSIWNLHTTSSTDIWIPKKSHLVAFTSGPWIIDIHMTQNYIMHLHPQYNWSIHVTSNCSTEDEHPATCLCLFWRRCLASPSRTDGSDGDLVQGCSLQARHSAWGTGHHCFNDSVPVSGREEVTGGPWHCSPFHSDTVADFWIRLIDSGYFGSWKRFWRCTLARVPVRITSFIILLSN